MRSYTEGVYPRKRNGKLVYDGVLAYYDENGKRRFKHRERAKEHLARAAIRKLRSELEACGPKALDANVVTFAQLADYCEQENYREAEITTLAKNCLALEAPAATKHISNTSENFSAPGSSRISRSQI
jgi:hypothetical protein